MTATEPDLLRLAGQLITGSCSRAGDPGEALSDLSDTVIGSGFCRWIGVGQLQPDFGLLTRGLFTTLFASHGLVQTADDLQDELGEGPHFHSGTGFAAVVCPDLAKENRWPEWTRGAAALGIHGVISLPVRVGLLGVVDLYTEEPQQFRRPDLELAGLIATHTATLLTRLHQRRGTWHHIEARRQIGQAQGILMARGDLDAGQALRAMQARAHRDGVTLGRTAAHVLSDDRADQR